MILSGGTTTLGIYDFKAGLDKEASSVNSANGETQQQINDYIGATWYARVGGYHKSELARLINGDIVKSGVNVNTTNPNIDMSQWLDVNIDVVGSIADLSKVPVRNGKIIYVKSYHEGLNKGGGYRTYVASQSDVNDGFLCINGWMLNVVNETVTPEQAGAYGDEVSDDRTPLQKAIDSKYVVQLAKETIYTISNALLVYSFTKIVGAGVHSSVIRKVGTRSDTGFGMSYDGLYSYEIDAILITKDYVYSLRLDDFSIDRSNAVANPLGYRLYNDATSGGSINVPSGYGLFSNALAKSKIGNFESFGSEYPIYVVDSWLNSWTNVHADGCQNWTILTGTSNTFIDCWATNSQGGVISGKEYCAYYIKGYYHNLVTVAADHCGQDGAPLKSLYYFEGGDFTVGALGSETTHAKKLITIRGNGTSVNISSIFSIGVNNKYRTSVGKTEGLFSVSDLGYLRLNTGTVTVTEVADISTKQCFADLTVAARLDVGALKLNDKITGTNDESSNQVYKDSGSSFYLNSGDTVIYNPADTSTAFYGSTTYSGNDAYQNAVKRLQIGFSSGATETARINFKCNASQYTDASIEVVSEEGTTSADYTNSMMNYAAFRHIFYGNVSMPTAYGSTTASAANMVINSDGSIQRSSSSLKYKANVENVPTSLALDVVAKLRPVTFTSTVDEDKTTRHYGFIAEEVAEVDSKLCFFNGSEVEGVQYDRIVPILVKHIQDLESRLKKLEDN